MWTRAKQVTPWGEELARSGTYLETPRAVISAGCALSFRSKAVCIVSLLLNTSCRSQRYPGVQNCKTLHPEAREAGTG